MTPAQVLHFLNLTPIWFWPLLAWHLARVNRWIACQRAAGAEGLYRIATDHRGRLFVSWVARPDAPVTRWTHDGPSAWELRDLDWESAMLEAIGRRSTTALVPARMGAGRTLPAAAILEPG